MSLGLLSKHASQRTSVGVLPVLVLGAVALGGGANVARSGAAPSSPARGTVLATAAATRSVSLSASLHLVGRPGHVIYEQGTISGTLSGTVSARCTSISSTKGTATFTIYTKGGSLSGRASTRGHVVGASVPFAGTAVMTSGTGVWAHAAGSNLQYSGVMNRQNYRIAEHLTGSIRS
jgi:hypothetical protein